jgi:hypothetical protein
MSHPRTDRGHPLTRAPLPLALLLAAVAVAADEPARKPDKDEPPAAAAKSTGAAGSLLRRNAPDKPWAVVEPKADLSSGDLLLALPLSGASLESKDGAVRLQFWGNLPQISSLPILESAVVLHDARGTDLDFTPRRGRLVLSNIKDKGAAGVRVRLPGAEWELTLSEPGTEVALETFGRWPRGVPFSPDPKEGPEPVVSAELLMLKGSATLKSGSQEFALSAPPGPAYFHWDSRTGNAPTPQRLRELPPWTDKAVLEKPEAKAARAAVEHITREMQSKAPAAVLAGLAKEADAEKDPLKAASLRRAAVYASAALDDLGPPVEALGDKHADAREAAVQALRAWIGRGPGQDLKLNDYLQKDKKFSKAHGEILLQLLHSYGDDDLARPETYEALIAYLHHERPAIRALAAWQLYRLAPAGKDIPYDPLGSPEELDKAYKAWKKLVPTGELPPRPKKEP